MRKRRGGGAVFGDEDKGGRGGKRTASKRNEGIKATWVSR